MLRTDLPDHRRATEEQLVDALRARDPLALAEAYHRTIPAAHAAARRLLSASAEVEALLRAVYTELWSTPPSGAALEAWIRQRCFALASEDLRERDAAPASPSLTMLLPELPRPEVRYLDAAERALAELDDTQRRALLLAHDKGVPTGEQDGPETGSALVAALLALAGPEPGTDSVHPHACEDIPQVGDWVLGLLPPRQADAVSEKVSADPRCAALAKSLRRGRRRLEGLPPTPDMGQRVLVIVLAGAPAPVAGTAAGIPSALDAGMVALPETTPAVDDNDTGEIPVVTGISTDTTGAPAPPGEAGDAGQEDTAAPDPGSIYGELAALDEIDDSDHPVALDDIAEADAEYAPDATPRRRRSWGRRILVWVLGALFMVAGVAAGLYLGLELLS